MATFACPECGDPLGVRDLRDRLCQSCGATLPDEMASLPAAAIEVPQRSAPVGEFESILKHPDARPLQSPWPDVKIRLRNHGETLAVLALLLPLVAQGLALACQFEAMAIEVAMGLGTVVVTALVLAVDAAWLGTTDLQGTRRSSPVALFFGILLLWVVFYPMAYFRRRHFGCPNLGPLALLVVVFFVAAPYVQNFRRLGILDSGVPTCTSREVISMVDDMIRKSAMGPSVQSISGHREISYDAVNQVRKGECRVKTQTETITATYHVKMLNPRTGTFQVDVDPIVSEDPPSCTDREVIALVERLIREGPDGHRLIRVAGHEETRYDRERKVRHGRCRATLQGRTVNVSYRVYWHDKKTGQFQVEIEP